MPRLCLMSIASKEKSPLSELRVCSAKMRGLLCLALSSLLLVSASVNAHDVDDDFDDEAEVEVEAEDTVVVEKVAKKLPCWSLYRAVVLQY